MAKQRPAKKSGKTTATQATGSGVIGKPPGKKVDPQTGASTDRNNT